MWGSALSTMDFPFIKPVAEELTDWVYKILFRIQV